VEKKEGEDEYNEGRRIKKTMVIIKQKKKNDSMIKDKNNV